MTRDAPKIRLFVEGALAPGASVALNRDQAHYLSNVMRLAPGAEASLFNGKDGEWRARLVSAGRRGGEMTAKERLRPQTEPPDLWLLFAPIKKARTDFIAEKAAEMGARRLCPVFTRFTNAERVNEARLRAHCIEAAEQCGHLSVPDVAPAERLDRALDRWNPARRIMFCDETLAGSGPALEGAAPGPWAILIGPEGGFAPEEASRLRALPSAHPVALGPRILRADTAAVAAMTLWQSALGDWR
ncbi:16S rRNA (uracil(1498)-N(3))-methyltransferase [Pikeienuella piscinae]|uniref:Ribosomal RNA small subunit methyltransferase E n=1 Tax=Pikeienuella piscinae TaxID=2748098 RepID=A0A7L5BYH7_9RHOB|nr:16S rRNA (uracil(1498)-N(3))-methyltransferase [Pikeienuella piscinae]QIE55898.1 16S rRNA (uracil(1498)-N(3))-methyltransferase [Pikeienuella piscinae]